MSKHLPTHIWPIKPVGKYPQVYVRTNNNQSIRCMYHEQSDQEGIGFVLTRRDARLLAKRLNQCLNKSK